MPSLVKFEPTLTLSLYEIDHCNLVWIEPTKLFNMRANSRILLYLLPYIHE